jgi:hypothetical protein
VQREIGEGTLGEEYDRADLADLRSKVTDSEEAAKDEVWAGYRFVVLADAQVPDGLKVIDLGAGHSSGPETLCGRVVAALKAEALLNESVGAGYIDRNWPPALKESGAWPMASLRQSFLNGSLTRLLDPDVILRGKIVEFVGHGDFGLASGAKPDGTYDRVWFEELVAPDEVTFEPDVFLLKKAKARSLRSGHLPGPAGGAGKGAGTETGPSAPTGTGTETETETKRNPEQEITTVRLVGSVPPEIWNRLGTKILPKLRSGDELVVRVDLSVKVKSDQVRDLTSDLRQILADLGLTDRVRIE